MPELVEAFRGTQPGDARADDDRLDRVNGELNFSFSKGPLGCFPERSSVLQDARRGIPAERDSMHEEARGVKAAGNL